MKIAVEKCAVGTVIFVLGVERSIRHNILPGATVPAITLYYDVLLYFTISFQALLYGSYNNQVRLVANDDAG